MLNKTIKEYKGRQRIDINKKDNMVADSEVVILTADEYDTLKSKLLTMQDTITGMEKELEIYQNQEQSLKEIIEDVNAPIHELYKKELKSKDDYISQLEDKYKTLYDKAGQYNLELMGLNGFEILFFRKHKKLIKTFDADMKLIGKDEDIVTTDIVPGGTGSSASEE